MKNESGSVQEIKRGKFDITYLLMWVIGVPLLCFIGAIIIWLPVDNNHRSPLDYLLFISFIGFGLIWNPMLENTNLKILIRYLTNNETQDDIKAVKYLKPIAYIIALISIILFQFIYQILS